MIALSPSVRDFGAIFLREMATAEQLLDGDRHRRLNILDLRIADSSSGH